MSNWTDKKIEKLKKLWEKGLSTAEIGKKLDFSKNAIVGKVHRLGLSNRTSPIKSSPKTVKKNTEILSETKTKNTSKNVAKSIDNSQKTAKKEPSRVVKNESVKVSKVSLKNKKTTAGLSLLELTSDLCCWPIDDINSENFHFCGKKVFKNKPYCLEHCAIAYTNSATPLEEQEANESSFIRDDDDE
ncbi:MAG: GcrA family cell cycle regulator [Alphaproteobacteria bacterium]